MKFILTFSILFASTWAFGQVAIPADLSIFNQQVIAASYSQPVLIEYSFVKGCPPCVTMVPYVAQVSASFPKTLKVVTMDAGELEETAAFAQKFQIRGFPWFRLYIKGKYVSEFTHVTVDFVTSKLQEAAVDIKD